MTVLDKFMASLHDEDKSDQKKVHSSFSKFCSNLKKTENRFVGGKKYIFFKIENIKKIKEKVVY